MSESANVYKIIYKYDIYHQFCAEQKNSEQDVGPQPRQSQVALYTQDPSNYELWLLGLGRSLEQEGNTGKAIQISEDR